jgi:hypothetical protein
VQLSAIMQARAIAFFEVADITPRNGLFFPELVKELVQRFNFQKYPHTLDEWQDTGGAQFGHGKLGTIAVDKLVLFNNGIQVDTHAGTAESKRIIEETLDWAREKFSLAYAPGMIKRWAYVSDLTFYTGVPILSTPALDNLAESASKALSGILGEAVMYEPTTQTVGHDPLTLKYGRAGFTIQRRLDVPFRENKYFSESPLPTEIHLDLLRKFEADVQAMQTVRIEVPNLRKLVGPV